MSNIPTQTENPKGLHQKYHIQKIIGDSLLPVDDGAEYFVLKLNEPPLNSPEYEHRKACRIAINAYADAIQYHLTELAKDLKERYPLLTADTNVSGEGWAASLHPSPTAPSDAIEFADWINNEDYIQWLPTNKWSKDGDKNEYTTSELYEIFKQRTT